jgi:hypothetical protein
VAPGCAVGLRLSAASAQSRTGADARGQRRAARISSNTINQIDKIQKSATPEMVAALKSGTISINAAATVATLPLDAQVAAVAGCRKELQ